MHSKKYDLKRSDAYEKSAIGILVNASERLDKSTIYNKDASVIFISYVYNWKKWVLFHNNSVLLRIWRL